MTTRDSSSSLGFGPGDVLAGKYRVERLLGQGGMGVVVAAHHLHLDEKVALKFLLPEALGNSEAVARFVREARAAAKIKNEHVARVSDVGQLENGCPYMVMEFLDGGDLAAWLHQRGQLPVELAVDFVLQACEAIADAHGAGIVHRDLKPANLFCIQGSDGQLFIKVLDFGISKVTREGAPGHDMTRTNALMGSPMYMSPEQMTMSKNVDMRTDIWSLGVILFELVTGKPPFDAEAVTELAIKVATQPPTPLHSLLPNAPAGFDQVIGRCLEKDRERRFGNVGELAVALKDFGSKRARASVEKILGTLQKAGINVSALAASGEFAAATPQPRSRSMPDVAPEAAAPGTQASWGQTGAGTKRGGRAIVGVAVGAVVAVGALAAFLLLRGGPPSGTGVGASAATLSPPPPASASVPTATLAPVDTGDVPPTVALTSLPAVSPPPPAPSSPVPVAIATPSKPGQARPGGAAPAVVPPSPPPATPPPVASAPPAKAKANCNPPYVIDGNGDRQYKPECL